MALFTANAGPILTDAQVAELLVQPVQARAVATQAGYTSTVVPLRSGTLRMPRVTADPSAQWTEEGQEIVPSDLGLDEIECVPRKITGLTLCSSEALDDSNEQAATVIGQGLTRDIARKIDQAFVGALAAPAPSGLASTTYTEIAPGPLVNLDPFATAVSAAEDLGVTLTGWITSPAMALRLATLKDSEGSSRNLLGDVSGDAAAPSRRVVEGRPLYVSPDVGEWEVWGVPADRVYVVVRTDAEVTADSSVFFTSDRVAIRARMRVAFGFNHEEALQHITFTAPEPATEPAA